MPPAKSSQKAKPQAAARRSASTTRSRSGSVRSNAAEATKAPPSPPRTRPEPASTGSGPEITIESSMVKGLARSVSRIVSQASTILEEELAAGIGAAKDIEARFLNIAEMRSASADEVMTRFRKDAHDVVDIVLDLINVPTRSLNGLAQRISIGESPAATDGAPTIALPDDVPAGGSGTVPFSLENDGDAPTAEFEFQATDLVNADGARILGKQVSFDPAKLTIPAHDRESITIRVQVPAKTSPGVYSGLVLASKLERLRAVLVVSVP